MPALTLPNGVFLHWRETGNPRGAPVVWIHGGSIEESSVMLADLEPLGDRARVLCPDTRGHGLSQKFERIADYTYPRKAEDLLLWLDALGVARAVWGGASMGAALSLWVAAHRPDRVGAVISISGPPYAPTEGDRRWWSAHRPLVAAGDFEAYFDANVRLRMGEAALARLRARPDRYAALRDQLRAHSVPSLLALLDETYSRTDWLPECARIRCPVLVVAGSEDHFPTPEMSRRVAATIPGARFHLVAGGGHFPNRTHRREVQDVIARFAVETGALSGQAEAEAGLANSLEGKENMDAPDLFRLDGSTALVVGGGGGLGGAMARGLAGAGAAVAVADAAKDRAGRVADAIARAGGRALAVEVDVTSAASVERMIDGVERALGPVDVLVNSAGVTRRAPAADFAEEDWHRVIAVNLTGVFLACQAMGRRMLERGRGQIVNIASIAGEIGLAGTVAYAASKGGVVNLTRALAVEWAPRGVRVNAIAPSWFDTDMGGLIRAEPGYAERAMRRVPMGRMGQPEELVGAVIYLASAASTMVTGHVLAVDGGTLAS